MNKREITEAWARKCRIAQEAGPRGQALILEGALLTAMQRAIPPLPKPDSGYRWVTVEWSYLDGQEISVEYHPEDGFERVLANGVDISDLLIDRSTTIATRLADQTHEAYAAMLADERHCEQMDDAEARAAA